MQGAFSIGVCGETSSEDCQSEAGRWLGGRAASKSSTNGFPQCATNATLSDILRKSAQLERRGYTRRKKERVIDFYKKTTGRERGVRALTHNRIEERLRSGHIAFAQNRGIRRQRQAKTGTSTQTSKTHAQTQAKQQGIRGDTTTNNQRLYVRN